MGTLRLFGVTLSSFIVVGCASVAVPRDLPSSLTHGIDTSVPADASHLEFAKRCLSGSMPAFWARYFNQSAIDERTKEHPMWSPDRAEKSFQRSEREFLGSRSIRLLPVFAQNVNHLGEADGFKHGRVNAKDLVEYVGADIVRSHVASKPLLVALNQETKDPPLTVNYWRGWTRGLQEGLTSIALAPVRLRVVIYARPMARHPNSAAMTAVLQMIGASNDEYFAGIWPVSPVSADDGLNANTLGGPRECGRLSSWHASLPDHGPIKVLVRQYVLDARDEQGRTIDLNAINPDSTQEVLQQLLAFDSPA